jgi:hypothetical protein
MTSLPTSLPLSPLKEHDPVDEAFTTMTQNTLKRNLTGLSVFSEESHVSDGALNSAFFNDAKQWSHDELVNCDRDDTGSEDTYDLGDPSDPSPDGFDIVPRKKKTSIDVMVLQSLEGNNWLADLVIESVGRLLVAALEGAFFYETIFLTEVVQRPIIQPNPRWRGAKHHVIPLFQPEKRHWTSAFSSSRELTRSHDHLQH